MEEPWRPEHEAAGHTACVVRKQRAMDAGPQLAFLLFYAVRDPSLWNGDCCLHGGSSHLS